MQRDWLHSEEILEENFLFFPHLKKTMQTWRLSYETSIVCKRNFWCSPPQNGAPCRQNAAPDPVLLQMSIFHKFDRNYKQKRFTRSVAFAEFSNIHKLLHIRLS